MQRRKSAGAVSVVAAIALTVVLGVASMLSVGVIPVHAEGGAVSPIDPQDCQAGSCGAASTEVDVAAGPTATVEVDGTCTDSNSDGLCDDNVTYKTIQAAITAALPGDTISVAPTTYTEVGQIVIAKNLTIIGDDRDTTIIKPAQDTGSSGDSRGWLLVNSGITLNLSHVTLDGQGKNIMQGVRSFGNGVLDDVVVQSVAYPGYNGLGVVIFGQMTVSNSTFQDIGRVGIIVFGATATGTVTDNSYIGKGPGDWLDYAIEVGGGGHATIAGNTISDCEGVAVSDGSTSAGILTTTYYGAGTAATVENNFITGNTGAVAVGYDGSDTSSVVIADNDLSGNTSYGVDSTAPSVDASGNWWGSNVAATVKTAANGGTLVDYTPWLDGGADTVPATPGFQGSFATLWVDDDSPQTSTTGRIQEGVNLVSGSIVNVAAGTYAENVPVNKAVDIRGPNYGISPNGGTRVSEAVVVPGTSAISSGEIFSVSASGVSISGFTIDGDNTALTSGYLGTNGADIDAAEGVTVYFDNVNNLLVSKNIFKNLSYFGVTLFGASYSAPATTGHQIDDNLFMDFGIYDAGSGIARWGGGVLLYNNQYTRITNNVMNNVRLGVQTGNFSQANPGAASYQVVDGNTMQVRRVGIFHNLHYGPTSAYTLSNNTITGLSNVNEVGVRGILLSSLSVPSTSQNNSINLSGVTTPSSGYEVWNVKSTAPASISGGSVSNVSIGLFLNNYEGYNSDASDGAHASVSGLSITPNAGGTGIRVLDSPSSTAHANVQLAIGAGVVVSGGTRGLTVENASASVTSVGNLALSGQSGNYIELVANANAIDATSVIFDGQTGATATLVQNFAIEDKVVHKLDNSTLGLVRVKTGELFVTPNSGSTQRGVDSGVAGDTVNVAPGTYSNSLVFDKDNLTLAGSDSTNRPVLTNGMSTRGSDSLVLRNLIVRGAHTSNFVIDAAGTNFTMERVTIDAENTAGRQGVGGGQINGDISITYCEFLNIKNWVAFDTRSGSGGPTSGADINIGVFSHNTVRNTQGHINFRGTINDPAASVTMSDNLVEQVGNATNSFGGILKVFYANSLTFTGNTIKDVGTSGYNPAGEAAYGAGLMPRNVANMTVTGNTFENNNQAIAIEPRNSDPSGYADGVLPGGTIANNTFTGNKYGVYVPATLHPTSSFAGLPVTHNSFTGSTGEAVHNGYTSGTLKAEENWWGSACGPSSVGPGSGDHVSANVDYSPWWTDASGGGTASEGDGGSLVIPAGATTAQQNAILACAAGKTVTYAGSPAAGGVVVNSNGVTINLNGATVGPGSPAFTINASDVTINGPGLLDGNASSSPGILVQAGVDNLVVQNTEITDWANGIEVAGNTTNLKIVGNWVHDNTANGLLIKSGVTVTGATGVINGNLFKANGANGVQNDGATPDLTIEYNSWGDVGGPTGALGDGVGGSVDYTPWTFAETYIDVNPGLGGDQYQLNVDESTSFNVELKLEAANLYGLAFQFTYDPTYLTFNGPPTFSAPWSGNCSVVGTPSSGTFKYQCFLISGSAWNGGTVATFNFTANGTALTGTGPWTTYFDISHLVTDTNAGAVGGVKVFVNNAGYGAPSIPARDITDGNDGQIDIRGIAQYRGYVDLQGRTNDSGAGFQVFAASAKPGTAIANATSSSSGVYTSAYVAPNLLTIGTTYYLYVDRALYLPTTAAAATSYTHSKALSTRPLTTVGTIVLLGGDANDNNVIDINDASCIGNRYNLAPATCGGVGSADVNGDGAVNILDLVLMGGNYDLTFSPWTP